MKGWRALYLPTFVTENFAPFPILFVNLCSLYSQNKDYGILFLLGFQKQLLQYIGAPTNTHSHQNLTIHILDPMNVFKHRTWISWL